MCALIVSLYILLYIYIYINNNGIQNRNEKAAERSKPGAYKVNEYVVVEAYRVDLAANTSKAVCKKGNLDTADAKHDNNIDMIPAPTLLGRVLVHTDVSTRMNHLISLLLLSTNEYFHFSTCCCD